MVFHPPPTLPEFAGAYLVERLLPISDAGPSYLIKRVKDGHVRSVSEQELATVHIEPDASQRRRKTG